MFLVTSKQTTDWSQYFYTDFLSPTPCILSICFTQEKKGKQMEKTHFTSYMWFSYCFLITEFESKLKRNEELSAQVWCMSFRCHRIMLMCGAFTTILEHLQDSCHIKSRFTRTFHYMSLQNEKQICGCEWHVSVSVSVQCNLQKI